MFPRSSFVSCRDLWLIDGYNFLWLHKGQTVGWLLGIICRDVFTKRLIENFLGIFPRSSFVSSRDVSCGWLMDIFSRDVYTKRFPELESLVVQPLEYLMTAKELGNQIENVKNNETLQQFLTQVFYLLFYVWLPVSLVKAAVFEV